MTSPEYLDPVRHELHQLRAKIAAVEALAKRWETVPALRRGTCAADLRIALADKEPTP